MNPYEVLGLKEDASRDEIRKAYRELVKKYHPDQYRDNPLAGLAEEKLREINAAYELLMKNGNGQNGNGQARASTGSPGDSAGSSAGGGSYSYSSGGGYSSGDATSIYKRILELIDSKRLVEAEKLLEQIKDRDGYWFYFKGVVAANQGRYGMAYEYFKQATILDSGNSTFQAALQQMQNAAAQYRQEATDQQGPSSDECCQACAATYCLCSLLDCFCR